MVPDVNIMATGSSGLKLFFTLMRCSSVTSSPGAVISDHGMVSGYEPDALTTMFLRAGRLSFIENIVSTNSSDSIPLAIKMVSASV